MAQRHWKQVLRYRFDNFMARGGRSIYLSLGVMFLCTLAAIGLLRLFILLAFGNAGTDAKDAPRNLYFTFLQMMDPGTMALDVTSPLPFKVAAVLAALCGVVLLSFLIGLITTGLHQKLNELKKGHSKVAEDGHTLILGWNERVVEILRELVIANESEESPSVVILAEEDKEKMDDYLKLHLPATGNTRIVTRSGSVSSLVNLDIVSVNTCKSAIVLASCSGSASREEKFLSDAKVIKTILAIVAMRAEGQVLNVVAEVFEKKNRNIVRQVAPQEIKVVDHLDILAKILVQTSRSIGLSVVYNEIFSFDGCEMYFYHADWGTITFGELAYRFPDGVPMGLRRAGGELLLNPPVDAVLRPDDDILILADDNSTIDFRSAPVAQAKAMTCPKRRQEKGVEREMILGWNAKAGVILEQYADYLLEGSTIDVMIRRPKDELREELKALGERLPKLRIRLIEKDPLKTENLIAAEPAKYDNIIILSQDGDEADPEKTDSETIITLLLLRNIFNERPASERRTKLITEVLDSENQGLVTRAGVHDFIISNRLVSMLLAQISEQPDMEAVYEDLFQESGSEIYLKPVTLYFEQLPERVRFADLIAAAQARGEVCLGVKQKALEKDWNRNYGVKLIPEKNAEYELKAEDTLVVLAEDET